MGRADYQRLAEVEVDAVAPKPQGFTLIGQGADGAQYQLDVRFEMPLDPRTRAVLGELLSQSALTISRRASDGLAGPLRARRERAHNR